MLEVGKSSGETNETDKFIGLLHTTNGYCSMKSDQTRAQTQTLLELHQMLYH